MSNNMHKDTNEKMVAKDLFEEFLNEIDFTKAELEAKTKELNSNINASCKMLETQIESLSKEVAVQRQANMSLAQEISKLILIPDKIQSRIGAIVPEIAIEVDKIYSQKQLDLCNSFNVTSATLIELREMDREEARNIIAKLLEDSDAILVKSRAKLFKGLAMISIFAAIISGVTSYFVTHYFPTHVSITGASSLEVRDSNVHIRDGSVRSNEPK